MDGLIGKNGCNNEQQENVNMDGQKLTDGVRNDIFMVR